MEHGSSWRKVRLLDLMYLLILSCITLFPYPMIAIVTIAIVIIAGSVLTSRPTPDCTLSGCSDNVQAAGETGYDVLEGM